MISLYNILKITIDIDFLELLYKLYINMSIDINRILNYYWILEILI